MPAIQLARLKKQIELLRSLYGDTQNFLRAVLDLFLFYADVSFRAGQIAETIPLMRAFNLPPPLIRQVVHGLRQEAVIFSEQTLAHCDALWAYPSYETRLLAIHLLSMLPARTAEVIPRILDWMASTNEPQLIDAMFTSGIHSLAVQNSAEYLRLAESWLEKPSPQSQILGLRALEALVSIPNFHNFPPCFRLLLPHVRRASPAMRAELSAVLRRLGRRSPQETSFFLHVVISGGVHSDLAILIRQSVRPLSSSQQAELRARLRSNTIVQSRSSS